MEEKQMGKEYRLVEGIGQYWNKRWEVQEKYSYYEGEEKVIAWHTVFHSVDKKLCEKTLKKYQTGAQKDYRVPFMAW